MQLTKRKALDATGAELDPAKLYTPISPHTRGYRVYNPDKVELRGDHEAIVAAPALWIRIDATTEEKSAARKAHSAAAQAGQPPPERDARFDAPPRIPQARRMIATETFWAGPHFVNRGAERDVDDAVVKRAPEYFKPAIEPDEAV